MEKTTIVNNKSELKDYRAKLAKLLDSAKMSKNFKYLEKSIHTSNNEPSLQKDIQFLFNLGDYSSSLEKNFSLLETKIQGTALDEHVIIQPGFIRSVKDQFYSINANKLGLNVQLDIKIKPNCCQMQYFYNDLIPERLEGLKKILEIKKTNDGCNMDKLELITMCTNPMPVLAKEVQKHNMDHAQWWMVNENTLSSMEMYNVEENDYAILVNSKGMIFYSGRQDDVDIKNQMVLMLKGKNPTQNIALSSKSKLDRRLLSVTRARYVEIKEFFRREFLRRIDSFKSKYDIGKFNSYWLDYSLRFTKTALVSGELPTTKYYCIDFHVKTIEPVYQKLLTEFPGIGELLTNQPGCNFLKIILRQHSILPWDKCAKCKKSERQYEYFFCRKCKICYCKSCGWTIYGKNLNNAQPPHMHYMYYVGHKSEKYKNTLQILKEEEWFEDDLKEHPVSCSSCLKKNFRGIRFKCAICATSNICETCFERIRQGGSELKQGLEDHGCKIDTHIYLAIFYNNVF